MPHPLSMAASGQGVGMLHSLIISVPLLQTPSDTAVGIAWDCAGVTTGEVTTPLILALGLGVAKATMAPEGFGLLALASLGPVSSSE